MKRVIEKINEVLKTRKSIGYIEIRYNNKKIGYFATKQYLQNKGIETTEFQILSKENDNCFMIERNLKLCKILGNLHTEPDKIIQIEMH